MTIRNPRRLMFLGLLSAAALVGSWMTYQRFQGGALPFQGQDLLPSHFIQAPHNIDTLTLIGENLPEPSTGISPAATAASAWLVGSQNGKRGGATFWDAASAKQVRQWQDSADMVRLSPDRRLLLTVAYEYTPKGTKTTCTLRDTVTGRVLRTWRLSGPSPISDVSRDFSLFLSVESPRSADGKISERSILRVQEMRTGRTLSQTTIRRAFLSGQRFSRDGRFVLVDDSSDPSQLLRVSDLKPILTLPPLESLRLTRNGRQLIGLSRKGLLHFWELPSKKHSSAASGLHNTRWMYVLKSGALVLSGQEGKGNESRSVIQVRSANGTRLLHRFEGWAEHFSSNGRFAAFKVLGRDARGISRVQNAYDVFDLETGKHQARLVFGTDALGQPLQITSFAREQIVLSSDGQRFFYASNDGLVRFYSLGSRNTVPWGPLSNKGGRSVISFEDRITSALVFPDGVVASGIDTPSGSDRVIRLARTNQKVQTFLLNGISSDVGSFGLSPDNRTLIGASQGGLWQLDLKPDANSQSSDATDGESGGTALREGDQIYGTSPDGSKYDYFPAGAGRPVWLQDAGKPFSIVSTGTFGGGPIALTPSDASGKALNVKVIIPQKKRLPANNLQSLTARVNNSTGETSLTVSMASASPDGRKLLVVWSGMRSKIQNKEVVNETTNDGLIEVRETATGRILRTLESPGPDRMGRSGLLGSPVWSPDGTRVAMSNEVGHVLIWDALTGHKIGQLSGTRTNVKSITSGFASNVFNSAPRTAFTPDSRFLAAGRDDGSIYLYSLESRLPIAQIGRANAQLAWMQFSRDGRTLYGIASNGKEVLAWDRPAT